MSKTHECKESEVCICYSLADNPNDNCPIHGLLFLPVRCGTCGKFIKPSFRISEIRKEEKLIKKLENDNC